MECFYEMNMTLCSAEAPCSWFAAQWKLFALVMQSRLATSVTERFGINLDDINARINRTEII